MSIQSPAKCEIRSVIRYLVWKGKTPVEVYNEVKTAYGDKGMNRTSVFKWCREFKNGRTSVHDDQRSGRPSILTDDIVENIENALRDDRRLTVDELSAMFPQISRSLLRETITETLGYRKLSARWVPKQLTDQHKLNRVEAGQEFLRRYKLHGDEFLRSIVTGDETWVEKSFQPTRRDWFRRFKNNDFQLEDKERSGAPKKFEDKDLEQLLDEDPSQTLSELGKILQVDESTVSKRLKGLGMIQKQGHWVPYELMPRDVERRFGTCELLLQRQKRKGFLSTITGDRYRLQLMRLSRALKEKRPLYAQRHDKVILLHDNARPHVAKPVKTYLETLKWEVLPHPPYSPDIAPSDFHLFRSMAHGLADRRFHSYEEAQKWIDSWIASKDMSFFRRGIHVLPERWEKVVESDGKYFH
ncbi:MOS1T transposase, partial [Pseudoatta argentina]